jgi:leucyl-tRNA synthetase
LEKVWDYYVTYIEYKKRFPNASSGGNLKLPILHKTIKKISADIESMRFNTSISQLMILINNLRDVNERNNIEIGIGYTFFDNAKDMESVLKILSPFAPHLAEELWEKLGHTESIFKEKWPEYDPNLIKDEEIKLVIQVNGKVRDIVMARADISEEEAKKIALESEKIKSYTAGKEIKKIIFVKGKLVSIVI